MRIHRMRVVLDGTRLGADEATAAVTRGLGEAGDGLTQAPGGRVPGLHVELARTETDVGDLSAAIADGIGDGVRRALGGR